jgi:putative membrane protein
MARCFFRCAYLVGHCSKRPAYLGFGSGSCHHRVLIMAKTRVSFSLTPLLYFWILLHCIVLLVGAKYTYAEVPLFDWISELFGRERNNYDKIGHLMQGFVPALLTREILLRKKVISTNGWGSFIVVSICLAFSAFYELNEWWVAALMGKDAEAFLGTQGYAWDTQSDMALALVGAILCIFCLRKPHDFQLKALPK